ncbi:hypothetical protein DFH09DRAFT_84284 [Mycena vulgaris]|nr:hypothetical protein DFH09DRAFT_84284 [Mycena vulgaris]
MSTFDPTRIQATDFIDVPRAATIFLEIFGHNPRYPRDFPFAKISFRSADTPHMRADTRIRGFLHYRVPLPSRPLSGGLRFRCTESHSPASFVHGMDLLTESGLPWTVPVVDLMWRGGLPILQSLLRDNLVHLTDIIAARTSFHFKHHPEWLVVHGIEQPWLLDLSKPTVILVPGPKDLLRCSIYPPVAYRGGAIVRFEHTGNSDQPHEVAIRILEVRSKASFRSAYAHLPSLKAGEFLMNPMLQSRCRWTWNYETTQRYEMAAGLYCLVNGAGSDPRPSSRLRSHLRRWFHHELPTDEELARYTILTDRLGDPGALTTGGREGERTLEEIFAMTRNTLLAHLDGSEPSQTPPNVLTPGSNVKEGRSSHYIPPPRGALFAPRLWYRRPPTVPDARTSATNGVDAIFQLARRQRRAGPTKSLHPLDKMGVHPLDKILKSP